jgi:hypothetical protein
MSDLSQMTEAEELEALRAENARITAERDAERQRAESESRRADGLTARDLDNARRINASEAQTLAAQVQQADSVIAGVNNELVGLKRQLAEFNAEGKFEEAAELQEKIGDATARRTQAQQAKSYYEQQHTQAAARPVDPMERFFAANNYTDTEKEWIRRNPRYATDPEFMRRVNAEHDAAKADGIAPQTPEYFQRLEAAGYMRPLTLRETANPRQVQNAAAGGDDNDSPYSDAATQEPAPVIKPRQSVAARPSGRAPATPSVRAPSASLNADEAEAALALSELMPDEVTREGAAAVYKKYAELKNSSMAARRRAEWASGG